MKTPARTAALLLLPLLGACSGAASDAASRDDSWIAQTRGGEAGGGTLTADQAVEGNTESASDDYEPGCGSPSGGGDHRWTFTPGEAGTYRVYVEAEYDSVLAVRPAGADELGCNDDAASKQESELVLALEAGQAYEIIVDGYRGAQGPYRLMVEAQPVPPNRRGRLTLEAAVSDTTAGGTDHHTPRCGSDAGSGDHIWHFTAPRAAAYRFSLTGQYDCVLAIVDDGGAEVGCNDDQGSTTQSEVEITLEAGRSYGVVVDGYSGAEGAYALRVEECGAVVVPGSGPSGGPLTVGTPVAGNTTGAGDQFTPTCGANAGSGDHAWDLTPTQSAEHRIRVDAQYDTLVAVFDASGREMACNDDAESTRNSELSMVLQPGQTYRIVVDGYSGGEGAYRLLVDNPAAAPPPPPPPPANPPIQGTLSLRQPVQGDTSVSADQFTPSCGSQAGTFDAVYQFTPRRTWRYRFHVTAQYDSVLAIFDSNGVEVASNDDHNTTAESQIITRLRRGQTYSVVVDGYAGNTGPYIMQARRERKLRP